MTLYDKEIGMNGKDINSNDFRGVYTALGINVNALGVVMLDTESIKVTDMVTKGKADLYETPKDSSLFWIRGAIAETGAHLTLLYGLLEHGLEWKPLIDTVLEGWTPPMLEIEKVGAFQTPYEDEPYSCIVAHVKVTDALLDGRSRLELLPHINTFVRYRPHITLAYVNKEAEAKWLREVGDQLNGKKLAVTNVNYGSKHGE